MSCFKHRVATQSANRGKSRDCSAVPTRDDCTVCSAPIQSRTYIPVITFFRGIFLPVSTNSARAWSWPDTIAICFYDTEISAAVSTDRVSIIACFWRFDYTVRTVYYCTSFTRNTVPRTASSTNPSDSCQIIRSAGCALRMGTFVKNNSKSSA